MRCWSSVLRSTGWVETDSGVLVNGAGKGIKLFLFIVFSSLLSWTMHWWWHCRRRSNSKESSQMNNTFLTRLTGYLYHVDQQQGLWNGFGPSHYLQPLAVTTIHFTKSLLSPTHWPSERPSHCQGARSVKGGLDGYSWRESEPYCSRHSASPSENLHQPPTMSAISTPDSGNSALSSARLPLISQDAPGLGGLVWMVFANLTTRGS